MTLHLDVDIKTWPMKEPFGISRGTEIDTPTIQVRLTTDDGKFGRGEACGVSYIGETTTSMHRQIEAARSAIEAGVSRHELLKILPPGGARFAVDSALWDLEAKRSGVNPFAANGVAARPVASDFTIGLRSLSAYESTARKLSGYAVLKVKVDAQDPIAAIEAVRRGAPAAQLIVDPNQAWTVDAVMELGPRLAQLGVVMLEQPVAVGSEAGLDGLKPAVPLCADELIDDVDDLDRAEGRFQLVNIKLDKSGGLTAAMNLAHQAAARGFGLMVGCMAGSSLAMAPAMVLAQRCRYVDLDGPLLQAEDTEPGFVYSDGVIAQPHLPALWG